jgi:alkyl hydroperoxide reductase subunit AhpC
MSLRLGDIAPDFTAETTEGTISLHEWLGGSWGVFFSNTTVNYPIIADPDRKTAVLYDMLDPTSPENLTVRSVFFIAPDKTIKLMITYPASTGRNFNEILRALDSVQLTANFQVATPVNWKHGEDCIILPAVPDEEVPGKFPKGHRAIKPYMRYTPQPDL